MSIVTTFLPHIATSALGVQVAMLRRTSVILLFSCQVVCQVHIAIESVPCDK